MSELTRRSFLAGSAGVASGAALLSGPLGATAGRTATTSGPGKDGRHLATADGAVVYVRDADDGGVLLMIGERSVEVRDRKLVRAVADALKDAED